MVLKHINIQIKSNVIRNIYEQHKTMIFTPTRTHTHTKGAIEPRTETLASSQVETCINSHSQQQ